MKIYERKTRCGSKYNIYDYCEQAHCHTSQLGQSLYKVFSFPNSGINKVPMMKKAFPWHYVLVYYGAMKS